jgi:hypothetical protein
MARMNEAQRRKVLEFVKPLAVGLDGATNFGDVARMVRACGMIADGREDLDPDRLFLLAVFSGQEKWSRRFGQGSRLDLLLASAGVAREEIRRLHRSLGRFEKDPQTPEEEIVHDARRLEDLGAYGLARLVALGNRERMDFGELAEEIERGARDDLRTEKGRALAARRLAVMRDYARELRREREEFGE